MQLEVKAWTYDMLTAIHEIEIFIEDVSDFSAYQADLKTRRAIERNLEIIGEAMNRVLKQYPEVPFTSARQIVETRNRIIHGYDTVSDEILWSIVNDHLPVLKIEVEQFLGE